MLRHASSLVAAAYSEVRLTPHDSRAVPAGFLRSRPKSKAFAIFYEVVNFPDNASLNGNRRRHWSSELCSASSGEFPGAPLF
jgi:hypothetical protein